MATADRVLSILGLYTIEQPEWTVDAIAAALNLSGSTAYQYVGSLVNAGLLVGSRSGRYTVGPAVIELDRLMRRFDPLIQHAQQALRRIVSHHPGDAVGLLCRIYRFQVMCVDQQVIKSPNFAISYERGRPMPLTRGAASKAILAHLEGRHLRKFYDANAAEVRDTGLGSSWTNFRLAMKALRKERVVAAAGELDPGLMGVSAPVFDASNNVLGSIGLVISAATFNDDPISLENTKVVVREAAQSVTEALRAP